MQTSCVFYKSTVCTRGPVQYLFRHIFSLLCDKSVLLNIKQCTHKPFDFSISFNWSLTVL